jgi:hypothetical protein
LAKTAYELWKEDQERRKKNPPQFDFKKANPVQYKPGDKRKTSLEGPSLKWETKNLQYVGGHGRAYNDRFTGVMNDIGVSDPLEIDGFRRWLDFQENTQKRRTKEEEDFQNIFDKINNFKPQAFNAPVKEETFLDKVKEHLPFNSDRNYEREVKRIKNKLDNNQPSEVDRFIGRAANSASLGAINQVNKRFGDGEFDKEYLNNRDGLKNQATDILATGVGYLGPGGRALSTLRRFKLGAKTIPKAAENATKMEKMIRNLKQVGQYSKEGALIGAGISSAEVGLKEGLNPDDQNWKDNLTQIGLETAGGAVLDPVLQGGVKGVENLVKRLRNLKNTETPISATESQNLPEKAELLGLPAPQLQLPAPSLKLPSVNQVFKAPGGINNPIPGMPNIMRSEMTRSNLEKNGLLFAQQGKNVPKTRIPQPLESTGDKYWQKELESFNSFIDESGYDRNRLTQEGLEDLWSQFAKYEDSITLEKAVDLAYTGAKGRQKVTQYEQPSGPREANLKDLLKQDDRITNLIKQLSPPRQPVSRKATLQESFDRIKSLAPPPKEQPMEFPLEFKKSIMKSNTPEGLMQKVEKSEINPKSENITAANTQKPLLDQLQSKKGNKGFEAITPQRDDYEDELIDLYADINFGKLKDISGFGAYMTDIYRNTKDVFGDKFPHVKENVLDPFDASKKEYVELQEKWLNKLHKEVVKDLGIKKNSKLSQLVQDYGEKNITLDQLKISAPQDWEKVVKADEWFRKAYDDLIDQVNEVRGQIFKKDKESKMVPKLDNYYRHFRELNGLEGLKNLFDTPAGIDPSLVGTSDFTTPKTKFAGFMQKRGLGPYKSDAVGGFLNYIPSASYAINIDKHIPNFRNLSKTLKESTGDSKNLNKYIEFLEDFANDLSGKTNFLDRGVQKVFGRKAFNGLHWLNNRVKANTILGNVGSVLAQTANIPNGVAFAKQHSVEGAARTIKSVVVPSKEIAQSGFLKERFGQNMYDKFDSRIIDQPKRFASWMMNTTDNIGTSFVWNSAYAKGKAQGVKDPIKYADDMTRNLIAGRGIGEVPLVQKSRLFQLIAPFQLEVANLWRVQKDFVKEKDFGGLITLYLASWMLNKGVEEVRGSGVTFDPVDAISDAVTEEDLTILERFGRVGGEVLSNVPLGQTLASVYPEYGSKNLPTREKFFGDNDPYRFGSGLLAAKGLQDPLYKVALPYGGNQVKKTKNFIEALKDGGAYNNEKTELKYPVGDNLENRIKGTLFGTSATDEAKEYYGNDRRPLSGKQTIEFQEAMEDGYGIQFYENLMEERKGRGIKTKVGQLESFIEQIEENNVLSEKEKDERIKKLIKKLENLKAKQ